MGEAGRTAHGQRRFVADEPVPSPSSAPLHLASARLERSRAWKSLLCGILAPSQPGFRAALTLHVCCMDSGLRAEGLEPVLTRWCFRSFVQLTLPPPSQRTLSNVLLTSKFESGNHPFGRREVGRWTHGHL